jgi:hypothetical protein
MAHTCLHQLSCSRARCAGLLHVTRSSAGLYCLVHVTRVQGPNPNKLPGKLGDKYPSFLPTHATDALQHIQTAVSLNSAALQAGIHDQQVHGGRNSIIMSSIHHHHYACFFHHLHDHQALGRS